MRTVAKLLFAANVFVTSASGITIVPKSPLEEKAEVFAEASGLSTLLVSVGPPNVATIEGVSSYRPEDEAASTLNRLWRWASATKQVVAVLVMQEVERGRIDLDAPVRRYLPALALPGGDAVTIRRLLQHNSGLFDPEDGQKNADGIPTAYLRSEQPPAPGIDAQCLRNSGRTPGSAFRYNNCDYVIAAAVLEAVTGQSLAELVEWRVNRKINLYRGDIRVIKPGERDESNPSDDLSKKFDVGRFGAAANIIGSARGLISFDLNLLNDALLRPESLETLWKGDPKLGFAALGVWSYKVQLKGCKAPMQIVERRGQIGNDQVRNVIAPDIGRAVVAFTDKPGVEFGEPWQGKGLTFDMLSTFLCPEFS